MAREQFKHYLVDMHVLTPIHIGGGEDSHLTKMDYIHDTRRNKLYLIDSKKFMQFLVDNKLYEEYIHSIASALDAKNYQVNRVNNFGWLKKVTRNQTDDYSFLASRVFGNVREEKGFNGINLFARTAEDAIYIPGSSIKGAIRNAVTNFHLRGFPENERANYQKEIAHIPLKAKVSRNDANDVKRTLAKIGNSINEKVFVDKELGSGVRSPIGLTISDTLIEKSIETAILKDFDYGINHGSEKKIPIFREYITPGQHLSFHLKIDQYYTKKTRIQSMDDLLYQINDSWKHLYDKGYWAGIGKLKELIPYGKNRIVLGANTGFHEKTLIHSIVEDEDQIHEMTKRMLHKDINSKIRNHMEDEFPSPRVINYVSYRGEKTLAGICELSYKEV